MNNQSISIVIPTYKEAANIPFLASRIARALPKEKYLHEIVIVDDNSCDGTEAAVKELQVEHDIHLIVRKHERGLASAVIDGIRCAKGEIIVVMDADLSHPPEKIPELIDKILCHHSDFVIGSRFVAGGSSPHFNSFRKMNALVSKLLAWPLTTVKDPMAGFFAFRKNLIKNSDDLNPLGFKIGLEIMIKTNPRKIAEIPITFEERMWGESKLSLREQINYLIHLQRLYQYKYTHATQMAEFALIGSVGMVFDLSMVHLCYQYLHIPYKLARVAGFLFAATVNFILNRIITFPDAVHRKAFRQYVAFLIVCLIGMSVNWCISVYLFSTVHFFNKHYLLAAFLGIVGGFFINFWGSKAYVFNKKPSRD